MTSSDELRSWARDLRLWAERNPYPKTVDQMISLAFDFEQAAARKDAAAEKRQQRVEKRQLITKLPHQPILQAQVSAQTIRVAKASTTTA